MHIQVTICWSHVYHQKFPNRTRVGGSLPLSIRAIASFIEVNDNYIDSYILVCFCHAYSTWNAASYRTKYNNIKY